MYNLLISTGIALALFLAVIGIGFSAWAAPIPAIIGFLAANFLLARRVGKKVQDLAMRAQKEIASAQGSLDPKQAKAKFNKAIEILGEGFHYEKWQFLIAAELHSNIGILEYVRKEFDAAKPHLDKAGARGPAGARAKAMLGCLAYRKKDEKAMSAAFEQAVKAGKKEPILWATYAWCLDQLDKRDDALRVLARGVEANPSDEKLKASMVALQNEKKFKMKAYAPEWYQFHLEQPPMDMGPGGGRRVIFQRR
ncbi:MAG: tetratricopeptide repeat protein [Deltaproteobacteria bacterium]|nr:tetratricopeptide repeat protein [Deltaproteobacteria bacterium]